MWHVRSRSGVATLRTAIHLLLTYLLTSRCFVEPNGRIWLVFSVGAFFQPVLCCILMKFRVRVNTRLIRF